MILTDSLGPPHWLEIAFQIVSSAQQQTQSAKDHNFSDVDSRHCDFENKLATSRDSKVRDAVGNASDQIGEMTPLVC